MPSPETNIVQSVTKAIQYTGSNSADIDAQVPGISITSESGGVLNLNSGQYILNTSDWIIFNGFITSTLSNSQYLNEWGCVALCSELETVVTELSDVTAYGAVRAMGMGVVPTLLLSQSTTVAVQIQPAMPDSGYSAYAVVFGGVNLGLLSITSVTVVDTDTVNVGVSNTGGLTVSGVTVMVHAID